MRTHNQVIVGAFLCFSASIFAQTNFEIEGKGFTIQKLKSEVQAFGNRDYVWKNVPMKFRGWQFTQVNGGGRAEMAVKSIMDGLLYVATLRKDADLPGWEKEPSLGFNYSSGALQRMHVYKTYYRGGTVMKIPQFEWSGTIVLAPALTHAIDGFGKPVTTQGKSAATSQPRLTTAIKARYEQTISFARQQYLRDLDAAQRAAMQVNDLEEANTIHAAIQEVTNGDITSRSFKSRLASTASARYAQTVAAARQQYAADLDVAFKSAMTARKLDEANEIAAMRKELEGK
ncbi:MAG: hypothetical protein WC740_00460 [Verrucomicrobiia bacterium]